MAEASISAVVRTSLFVRDLAKATRFYRALGLTEVYYEGELGGEGTAPLMLGPDCRLLARILKRPREPNFGMLGLFQVLEPRLEALPTPAGPPLLGEATMVFYVPDIDAAMAAARTNGAQWTPDPVLFKMPHLEQREVCLRDPDGILVNFIESPADRSHIRDPEPHTPLLD